MLQYKTKRVLGLAVLLAPLAATAADGEQRPGFEQADANGDGAISMKEAQQAGVPQSEAKREDIDNDGKLTKADWKFVDMNPGQDSGSGSSS